MHKRTPQQDPWDDPGDDVSDDRHEMRRHAKASETAVRATVIDAIRRALVSGASGTPAELSRHVTSQARVPVAVGLAGSVLRELQKLGDAEFVKRAGGRSFWRARAKARVADGLVPFVVSEARARYAGMRQELQRQAREFVLTTDGRCIECGRADGLQAAHLLPVKALVEFVDHVTAHQPFLMVTLCEEHHDVFDGRGNAEDRTRRGKLHEKYEQLDEHENTLLPHHLGDEGSWRSIDKKRDRVSAELARLDAASSRIRQALRTRVFELVRARLGINSGVDVEEELRRRAVFAFAKLNDLAITQRGFQDRWKAAGWQWNGELSVWFAAEGTTAPPNLPPGAFRLMGKEPEDVEERYRENGRFRAERQQAKRRADITSTLALMKDGAVPISKLNRGSRTWSSKTMVDLGFCENAHVDQRPCRELTPIGRRVLAHLQDERTSTDGGKTEVVAVTLGFAAERDLISDLLECSGELPEDYQGAAAAIERVTRAIRAGVKTIVFCLPSCEFELVDVAFVGEAPSA